MTEFEIFQDPGYFDMWCLRQKSDNEFAMTLHFPDRNQAVHAKAVILEFLKREREACARLCEESRTKYVDRTISEPRTIDPEVARVAMMTCDFIAHDIRQRGK